MKQNDRIDVAQLIANARDMLTVTRRHRVRRTCRACNSFNSASFEVVRPVGLPTLVAS